MRIEYTLVIVRYVYRNAYVLDTIFYINIPNLNISLPVHGVVLSCSRCTTKRESTKHWWRERSTSKGQNVITTTDLRIENNRPLQYKYPRKGLKYVFGQANHVILRCKREFYKNFRKKIFNELVMHFNRSKLQRVVI
jgi:hypothetical protein